MSLYHNGKGMIVVGYQGIGKTSISSKTAKTDGIIDLESSLFKISGERIDGWYVIYCKVAVSLAHQGYIVLTSSHECVREELARYDTEDKYTIVVICPHPLLEDQWIQKLHNRYIKDKTDKNYVAWKDSEQHFSESIKSISSNTPFSLIFINSMNYDLFSIVISLYRASQCKSRSPFMCDGEGC